MTPNGEVDDGFADQKTERRAEQDEAHSLQFVAIHRPPLRSESVKPLSERFLQDLK